MDDASIRETEVAIHEFSVRDDFWQMAINLKCFQKETALRFDRFGFKPVERPIANNGAGAIPNKPDRTLNVVAIPNRCSIRIDPSQHIIRPGPENPPTGDVTGTVDIGPDIEIGGAGGWFGIELLKRNEKWGLFDFGESGEDLRHLDDAGQD